MSSVLLNDAASLAYATKQNSVITTTPPNVKQRSVETLPSASQINPVKKVLIHANIVTS